MNRDETIGLFLRGREAGNAWAEKLLAERKAFGGDAVSTSDGIITLSPSLGFALKPGLPAYVNRLTLIQPNHAENSSFIHRKTCDDCGLLVR